MTKEETVERFQHRAGAYGVSGKFTRPIQESISVRPSCDLPPTGGYSRIREECYSLQGLVSFQSATTEVSGTLNEEVSPKTNLMTRAANNLSLSVIEGFDLLDVISIDKIVSRITTRYFEGSGEIEIVLMGTRFEGFRIAGHEVNVRLATDIFLKHCTPHGLATTCKERGSVWERLKHLSGSEEFSVPDSGYFDTTIVEAIEIAEPHAGITVVGNRIDIDHIGKLYLGELTVTPNSKSLNMIRWALGSPTGGDGSAGGGSGGGETNGVRPNDGL